MTDCYDFIAIGLGPFNLSLACLAEPVEDLNGLFLDENPDFNWHPGMMLEGTHLQTPFLSDLVTLADPTSPYSFLNYIKQQGRIYAFYIRENFFLQRREYNQYCRWATERLSNVRFNTRVESITFSDEDKCYHLTARCTSTGRPCSFRTRKLVLGTGPRPYLPDSCQGLRGNLIHSSDYLEHKATLQADSSITIIGSGQSAAEIFYDLLQDADQHAYALNWFTRSPRFFPLEYSKLTLEMTSPEYVDYFYHLPPVKRDQLIREQKHLYKGINTDLINAIHDLLYIKRLQSDIPVKMMCNTRLTDVHPDSAGKGYQLALHHTEQNRSFREQTRSLIMATGYQYQPPTFLQGIHDRIDWDDQGRFAVRRNYSIDSEGDSIFVQNAKLHTHGFVTPDLGMACYRNASILRELTGREPYPVEQSIAFQTFGVPHQKAAQLQGERL